LIRAGGEAEEVVNSGVGFVDEKAASVVGAGVYDFGVAGDGVHGSQVANGALMVGEWPEDLLDVVFFGNVIPRNLLVRQNLIDRRPPEVAVGNLAGVVQTQRNLPNIARNNGGTVPGGDFIGESGPPVDEVLGRFPARRAGGRVDFG